MKTKTAHWCSVYGCMNNQRGGGLSFFNLPTNCERRNEWLKLIGRPDLLNKTDLKPTSYRVCSIHFEKSMMSCIKIRKTLPDAVPTKFLTQIEPSTSKYENESKNIEVSADSDISTQTKGSFVNLMCTNRIKNASMATTGTQTDNPEQIAQPSVALSSNTPRKRKVHDQLRAYKNKTRRLHRELNTIKEEIEAKNTLSSDEHDDEVTKRIYKLICKVAKQCEE